MIVSIAGGLCTNTVAKRRSSSLRTIVLVVSLILVEIRIWISNLSSTTINTTTTSQLGVVVGQLNNNNDHNIAPPSSSTQSAFKNNIHPSQKVITTRKTDDHHFSTFTTKQQQQRQSAAKEIQPHNNVNENENENEPYNNNIMCRYNSSTTTNSASFVSMFPSLMHPVWMEEPLSQHQHQQQQQQHPHRPLSVGLVLRTLPLRAEAMHIFYDGIQGSEYLKLTQLCLLAKPIVTDEEDEEDEDDEDSTSSMYLKNNCTISFDSTTNRIDLWIVNALSVKAIRNFRFHPTIQALFHPSYYYSTQQQKYHNKNKDNNNNNTISSSSFLRPPFQVLMVDYSDKVSLPKPKFYTELFRPYDDDDDDDDKDDDNEEEEKKYNNNKNYNISTTPIMTSSFSHIRIAMRTIVKDRYYDPNLKQIIPGWIYHKKTTKNSHHPKHHQQQQQQFTIYDKERGGPPLHSPYPVRTDIVQMIQQVVFTLPLRQQQQQQQQQQPPKNHTITTSSYSSSKTNTTMSKNNSYYRKDQKIISPAIDLQRPIDVMHMWVVGKVYNDGLHRNDVSKLVAEMNGMSLFDDDENENSTIRSSSSSSSSLIDQNGTNTFTIQQGRRHGGHHHQQQQRRRIIQTSTELHGKNAKVGRNQVSWKYVQALLTTKIVICVQRDTWEDHYRLMEGLVSGAMIITDSMLGLPRGLQNGTSIVMFTNLQQLKEQIIYYLQHEKERYSIAQKGYDIAMQRHRSWHRLEELIFGCPLTHSSPKSKKKIE